MSSKNKLGIVGVVEASNKVSSKSKESKKLGDVILGRLLIIANQKQILTATSPL
jgi:hypothetical protein